MEDSEKVIHVKISLLDSLFSSCYFWSISVHRQPKTSQPAEHTCRQKVPAPLSDTTAGGTDPHHTKPPRQWCHSSPQHPWITGIHNGWTLSQERPALPLCRTRPRPSSRATKCIAALRCCFYRLQSSGRLPQKVRSKNQSAKWIWLRCSQTMAPLPCLRNTQGACITLLGSEATAQLICNYGTSWWPKAPCCVIWASQYLWQ